MGSISESHGGGDAEQGPKERMALCLLGAWEGRASRHSRAGSSAARLEHTSRGAESPSCRRAEPGEGERSRSRNTGPQTETHQGTGC